MRRRIFGNISYSLIIIMLYYVKRISVIIFIVGNNLFI